MKINIQKLSARKQITQHQSTNDILIGVLMSTMAEIRKKINRLKMFVWKGISFKNGNVNSKPGKENDQNIQTFGLNFLKSI